MIPNVAPPAEFRRPSAVQCEEKMVVSLTLQNMQEESDSIRSIPAATCSAAQDIGGVKVCLAPALKLFVHHPVYILSESISKIILYRVGW